ncbi:MAG: hypothetical protein ACXWHI_06575, partial [Candidatus Aminicenantales bacterium]
MIDSFPEDRGGIPGSGYFIQLGPGSQPVGVNLPSRPSVYISEETVDVQILFMAHPARDLLALG